MGRSKFPGKPSKSINRKRISVLQLEDEATATAGGSNPSPHSDPPPPSEQPPPPPPQQTESQTGAESAPAREKGGHNNCDNDEDDNPPGAGASISGNATGTSSSSTSESTSNGSSSSSGSGSGSGSTNGNGVNGGTHHKSAANGGEQDQNANGDKSKGSSSRRVSTGSLVTIGPTAGAGTAAAANGKPSASSGKSSAGSAGGKSTASTAGKSSRTTILSGTSSVRSSEVLATPVLPSASNSGVPGGTTPDVAAAAALGSGFGKSLSLTISTSSGKSNKGTTGEGSSGAASPRPGLSPSASSASSAGLLSPGAISPGGSFAISAALLRARKNGNKKFKNLNLARAEVMLPSTSKLKQQQLQLNCPVAGSPSSSTSTSSAPAATTCPSAAGAGACEPVEDAAPKRVASEMPNEGALDVAPSSSASSSNGAGSGAAVPNAVPAPGGAGAAAAGSSSPNSAAGAGSVSGAGGAAPAAAGSATATKQKKTVTFRNVLETSDDKSVVKRFYNPDNRIPLVSIMKKDSLNRPLTYSRGGECIVRPSILSKILNKKNSNIDKLNSLKFRSVPATSSSSSSSQDSGSGSSPNVFGLSRAFGAPMEEDDDEQGGVTFRRNEYQNKEMDDEMMDEDDDVEDAEDEEDDNDQEELDEAASDKSAETEKSEGGAEDSEEKQQQLVMDSHFVLPKRSTRSSRIIKPNKRLLEEGAISKKPLPPPPAKSLFGGASAASSNSPGILKIPSFGSLKSNTSAAASSSSSIFVLRQPRLQFQGDSKLGPSAIPTTPAAGGGGGALTVSTFGALAGQSSSPSSCAVCSTTVKEMTQARKYGVVACDVCRKFISKMTKKSISATSSSANANAASSSSTSHQPQQPQQLQCKGSEGTTCIFHSGKSQLKNFKKLYKERCLACWLKKCLNSFQLPAAHRSRLGAILPAGMRPETNPREDKISTELLSPTGSLRFAASSTSSASASTSNSGVKWKSNPDSASALPTIKANPLAENNVTFGSTPLLRPAILEKPLFLKISNAADQKLTGGEAISPSLAGKKASIKQEKAKEKEKEKEQEQLPSEKPLSPALAVAKKSTASAEPAPTESQKEETPQTGAVAPASSSSAGTSQSAAAAQASEVTPGEASNAPGDGLKRQRIDLKGPRVKHVCRSASIVLGQPLATFGEDQEEVDEQERQEIVGPEPAIADPAPVAVTDENDNCASCKTPPVEEPKPSKSSPAEARKVAGKEAGAMPAGKVTTRTVMAASKKQRNGDIITSSSASSVVTQAQSQTQGRRTKEARQQQQQQRTLISIDFWENYDPAEVCQSGFGLIVTETVAQRALCFLCGSTGLDPLIFCACCCEPYHQYCVQDEYNLKHGSFEETTLMGSLLETTINASTGGVGGGSSSLNQLTQRLNWLCPRCTVCYTCNMSSGSKVKCQKCQKNYHSTCLGTSKRLLGADRPLICVNCLKCKSCSTTKVSKFVGNLPMCTGCFKLRKKGNFCPICQRCYDDNDFDLKMMECGDCGQWVHSKCEGLSDEQYNLLSTLPESIEFICKKCARRNESSRIKAEEWRQAVMEEFKASLYSVLKLLSKSRQACALLKLSPRKKLRCTCGAASHGKLQPKALQFNSGSDNGLGSDGESQNSDDVYEFKEQQQQLLKKSRAKSLPCSCQPPSAIGSSHSSHPQSFSLVEIKQKIAGNSYVSLAEFNYDMSQVIQQSNCDELDIAYKELLSEQFPWFQNETKACTDALEEDMFESCSYEDLPDGGTGSASVYNEHSQQQTESRSGVLDIPLEEVDDLGGSCGIKMRLDTRMCLFCRKSGEGLSGEEARLLYCGHDCWVHTNCAMWSAEVFEEIDGSLQNVHSAVARGRMIKCTVCGNRGATVGCNVRSCGEHYHYPCARSIECAFLTDKSMYCPAHAKNGNALKANGSPSVTYESNFEVSRPVYVELDRKRKKLIEPARVQFHIGSLEVRQLGAIVPRFSDSYEAVVPINFLCSRLYWSSKEPWKIVEYTVRTTIQNSCSTLTALDVGRNYTVDHTNPNGKEVQLGLAQIARWHSSLARSDLLESDWSTGDFPNTNSCVPPDENTEEEPQQQADLLPPEIKDAIFEDLPHELLDGISMLDIFMYEDLADKTDLFAISDQSKDGTQAMSSNQAQGQTQGQVSICDEDTRNSNTSLGNGGWPASNPVEDAMLSAARNSSQVQMLKTLAWPKLDGNSAMANAIKRRKLSKNLAEGVLLTLSNQQRTKKEMAHVAGVSRRQSISETISVEGGATTSGGGSMRSKSFTWSAAKRYFEKSEGREEPAKMRIMQMDGVDDSITEFRIIAGDGNLSTAQFTGQVKCERCQCTYRNYDSFQRHLPTCCDPAMSTSESDSDVNAAATSSNNPAQLSAESLNELQKQLLANAGGLNYLQTTTASFPQVQSLGSLGQFGLQGLQPLQLQPQSLGNGFFISQPNPTAQTNTDELQLYANSLQSLANLGGGFTLAQPTVTAAPAPQPQLIAVSTNPDGTQQFIQIPQAQMQATTTAAPTATYQTLQATNTDKKIMLPLTTAAAGKPLKTVATKAAQQAAAAKQKQLKSGHHQVKPIQAKLQPHPQQQQQQQQQVHQQVQQPITVMGQNLLQPQLLFQSSAQAQAPQLILPQAQPQNIISFVTTGDGSQGQPLQYISIPTTGEYKPQPQPTQFLTTAPAGGGATYLQTDASGNLMLTTTPTNSGLQMLTAQPQVIGTLIQPQTLQLSGATDGSQAAGTHHHHQQQVQPLILGGTGGGATGLEFATTTTPQVILATQPMYYGLETIVQNTVMSSQQFVSTAMPGVLSQNASFSATTTQVFQASKIEPIVDHLPAGYVVLNNPGDASSAGTTFLNAASVLQQQSQDDTTTQQLLQNANFQFQTSVPSSSAASSASMDYSSPMVVTAKIPPVTTQLKRTNAQAKAAGMSKVPPQPQVVVNKVLPTSMAQMKSASGLKQVTQQQQQMKGMKATAGAAGGTGTNCGAPPSIASKPLQKKTNMIRPIHKLEVKPKLMKPTPKTQAMLQQQQQQQLQHPAVVISSQQVPKIVQQQQRIPTQPQQQQQQPTQATAQLLHIPQQPQQTLHLQQQQQQQVQVQPSMPIISIAEATPVPVLQNQTQFVIEEQQQQQPQQDLLSRVQVQHFPTSNTGSSSNCNSVLPTNVVNPLQQQPPPTSSSSSTTRPTNRVLPMQQRQEPAPLANDCPVVPSPTPPPKPLEQQVIPHQVTTPSAASKCYAQLKAASSPSPVYETELKSVPGLESIVPVVAHMDTILEEQPATESIYTEGLYEKHSPADAKTEQLLLQQQQREQLTQQLANGYSMHLEKHSFQAMEAMETDAYNNHGEDDLDEELDEEDEEDDDEEDEEEDDFSLKMATSACNDHEMSDSEEPAVKDKISKILDNLTNDDCADSITTATTMEVVEASTAGYQQMVEDVLATTAAPEFDEGGPLETAAVEAAASYINEMADAQVLELKQLQNGVELELKLRRKQEMEPEKGASMVPPPTLAAPEVPPPPPPVREPRKISGPHLLYEIQSEDGFTYKSSSIAEIWEKVFEAVQVARRAHGLTPLPEGPLADMGGIQMIGLKTNALKYLIEQLPGVEKCSKYTPKYHKRNGNVSIAASIGGGSTGGGGGGVSARTASAGAAAGGGDSHHSLLDYGSDQELELQENAFECARCEPYANRSEYDMFSWLASRHRKQPIQVFVQPSDNELVPRRGTGSNLPMAMKYRTLKETYKDYVGVFRSHIHGRGLYCTKDIEAGEMVIEYAGELIRSTLTDKRERYYDGRGIGCYMFKIDDNLVVDATMRGNAARFINHSCEPNCYSKVVDILGHKHIIIFALRRIVQGEELTYDYKFPFEEEKIPCSCGSKRCRKYLN
ncbi:histone-lysine N-methyltransferase trithorax [Drosophila kikkawai]|uniref:Histone-lysine N-methyltransferase trithorax n=1 Tax=Drosophila kikkawai TaxID=30033 RepID=A0A6P4IMJ6_DROKI|nr:histone-lysine N-methyltransferase trithorax isoform X1 [Drosophila kikkawai]XP_017023748.1 histone-lysine N-methyltransferase trithorax isoform X1 [Drosophila kikkawai]